MGEKRIKPTDVPKSQWRAQAGQIKPMPIKQIMQHLFTFAENTLKCSLQEDYSWKRNPQEGSSWHFMWRTLDSSCLQWSSHETRWCHTDCPSMSTSSPQDCHLCCCDTPSAARWALHWCVSPALASLCTEAVSWTGSGCWIKALDLRSGRSEKHCPFSESPQSEILFTNINRASEPHIQIPCSHNTLQQSYARHQFICLDFPARIYCTEHQLFFPQRVYLALHPQSLYPCNLRSSICTNLALPGVHKV